MKKRILYIIGSIAIILLSIYLLRYKTGSDISHNIPGNAVAVVNINLRNLEHHLLVDFLKRPFEYFNKKPSKTKEKTSFKFSEAVELPKNLFFYTTQNNYSTWFSTPLLLTDKESFLFNLPSKKFKKVKLEEVLVYKRDNFYIFVEDKHISLCFSAENVNHIVPFYKEKSSLLDQKSDLFNQLKKTPNDLVFVTNNSTLIKCDFVDGAIDFKGTLKSDLFNTVTTNTNKGLIGFNANINKNNSFYQSFIKTINRDKFAKVTQMNFDSIQTYWNGHLDFKLRNFIKQTDTIKTYEYDDDFNKIEKIAVQENIMPDFAMCLGTNNSLKNYLINQHALQLVENDTIFTSFPFVKTHVTTTENKMYLYTKSVINKPTISSNFDLYFDIKAYQKQSEGSIYTNNNIGKFSKVAISIDKDNRLSAKLLMRNKRNAIIEFIKN